MLSTKSVERNGSRASSPTIQKTKKLNGAQVAKAELVRSITQSSVSSEASSLSASMASAESSGATSAAFSASSQATTKVAISQSTKVMKTALEEACFNLRFEGGLLKGDCLQWDGSETLVERTFVINEYLANVAGKLVWDASIKNFLASCRNISIKDGFILVAECLSANGVDYIWSEFDLRTKLRVDRGELVEIIFDTKLTRMLTEVPWMKFKVIAEPDLSVFAGHPVIKDTMVKIAQSTVQHVTLQMSQRLQAALQLAISEVTISAIQYINSEMDLVVQQTSGLGAAEVHASCTNGQYLHQMYAQDLGSFKGIMESSQNNYETVAHTEPHGVTILREGMPVYGSAQSFETGVKEEIVVHGSGNGFKSSVIKTDPVIQVAYKEL